MLTLRNVSHGFQDGSNFRWLFKDRSLELIVQNDLMTEVRTMLCDYNFTNPEGKNLPQRTKTAIRLEPSGL